MVSYWIGVESWESWVGGWIFGVGVGRSLKRMEVVPSEAKGGLMLCVGMGMGKRAGD